MAGRKGAIAFGLVYIPVELFTATQDDAVRFNQLAKDSMKRVRYVKTCPDCKRELKPEDIVKGYQYEKGKYVVVDDEELSMAKQLVESMTAPFDPSRFRNTYQEKLMQLIQDKIAGKQIVAESQEAQPSNIINLMDALSASLKARDGKDGESKKPAPAKKTARKRASA